jgi:hypothetical protein
MHHNTGAAKMAKQVTNRWGNTIAVGQQYRVAHGRDGAISGPYTVQAIDKTSRYAKAYGTHARIETGGLVHIDDFRAA